MLKEIRMFQNRVVIKKVVRIINLIKNVVETYLNHDLDVLVYIII